MIEYLRTRELLLLIDNCEHVLDAAARLIDQIVRHCPRVSVLVTSREALGIEGERIVSVPPLPVEDATELFVDRARASRPGFRSSTASRSARSPRSAAASTACRSRSNWRRPGCGR